MTDSFAHSISIIIPTLNEEENIAPLVSEIAACAVPFGEILFVNDHSIDETCDKVRALAGTHPIRLIEQDGAGPRAANQRFQNSFRGKVARAWNAARP